MSDALPRSATRADGEALPCPDRRAYFDLEHHFSADEVALIRRGFIPGGTDDRWFIFVEDDRLYCHRSWTGACIFGARIEADGDGARLTDCWVSRDTDDYAGESLAADRDKLIVLIQDHLLERCETDAIPFGFTAAGEAASKR